MSRAPAFLTVPECARLAGISVRRMRAIINARRGHDAELIHGTRRRPLIQRAALAKLLGADSVVMAELEDHEHRITVLERRAR